MPEPTRDDKGARHHWERAQKAADNLRAMLLALASGGVGASYVIHDDAGRGWWLAAATAFLLALACTLRSWFLVKARALDRAKVLVGEKTEDEVKLPKSKWSLRSSWVWDTAAAWAIVLGAVWFAVGLVLER